MIVVLTTPVQRAVQLFKNEMLKHYCVQIRVDTSEKESDSVTNLHKFYAVLIPNRTLNLEANTYCI